jgi:hypothetical protein
MFFLLACYRLHKHEGKIKTNLLSCMIKLGLSYPTKQRFKAQSNPLKTTNPTLMNYNSRKEK